MERLFEVELKTTVVVLAENENDAYARTNDEMMDIKRDTNFDIDVICEVKKCSLPGDWDDMSIPYGGDGNTRIKELNA